MYFQTESPAPNVSCIFRPTRDLLLDAMFIYSGFAFRRILLYIESNRIPSIQCLQCWVCVYRVYICILFLEQYPVTFRWPSLPGLDLDGIQGYFQNKQPIFRRIQHSIFRPIFRKPALLAPFLLVCQLYGVNFFYIQVGFGVYISYNISVNKKI